MHGNLKNEVGNMSLSEWEEWKERFIAFNLTKGESSGRINN